MNSLSQQVIFDDPYMAADGSYETYELNVYLDRLRYFQALLENVEPNLPAHGSARINDGQINHSLYKHLVRICEKTLNEAGSLSNVEIGSRVGYVHGQLKAYGIID